MSAANQNEVGPAERRCIHRGGASVALMALAVSSTFMRRPRYRRNAPSLRSICPRRTRASNIAQLNSRFGIVGNLATVTLRFRKRAPRRPIRSRTGHEATKIPASSIRRQSDEISRKHGRHNLMHRSDQDHQRGESPRSRDRRIRSQRARTSITCQKSTSGISGISWSKQRPGRHRRSPSRTMFRNP